MIRDVVARATEDGGAVVGIVDPPRAGLHKDVVLFLRRTEELEHLVYVSCSLGGARSNLVRRPSIHVALTLSLAH